MAHNTEAERRACEIRLRAERKAGQLIAQMDKNRGGRPTENRSHDTTGFQEQTLADLGISKDQSRQPCEEMAHICGDPTAAYSSGGSLSITGSMPDLRAREPVPRGTSRAPG